MLPGFPWEGKFRTKEEIEAYFENEKIQCLLCGKWFKQVNSSHLINIHNSTVDEYRERYGLPRTHGLTGTITHEIHSQIKKQQLVEGQIPWLVVDLSKQLTIDEMHQLAKLRGGKCLSTTYINSRKKLLWECAQGHRWEAKPAHIKEGQWCRTCARAKQAEAMRLGIEEMRHIARSRGGKCLSTTYINTGTKLLWECAKGHQWEARPHKVKRGYWCPSCTPKRRGPKRKKP